MTLPTVTLCPICNEFEIQTVCEKCYQVLKNKLVERAIQLMGAEKGLRVAQEKIAAMEQNHLNAAFNDFFAPSPQPKVIIMAQHKVKESTEDDLRNLRGRFKELQSQYTKVMDENEILRNEVDHLRKIVYSQPNYESIR